MDTVLERSVRTDGARLRVTAQLNNAHDGFHYRSRTWDRGTADVFAVQQEIAREVVKALGQPREIPSPPIKPLTQSWEAYDSYLHITLDPT